MIIYKGGGGLSRSSDYGSKSKPYPSVSKEDFAGGGRSYPIPTHADAVDALRLAGMHGRSDVRAKVYAKYPDLKKANGGEMPMMAGGGQANKPPTTNTTTGVVAPKSQYPLVQNPIENATYLRDIGIGKYPGFSMGEALPVEAGSNVESQLRSAYDYPYTRYTMVTNPQGEQNPYPVLDTNQYNEITQRMGVTPISTGKTVEYAKGGQMQMGCRKCGGSIMYKK